MAKRTRLSDAVVNVQADALAQLLSNGFIDVYDGEQPRSADEAITDQRLGVTLRFGSPAFQPATDGKISANPLQSGLVTMDLKRATWARCTAADHRTVVMDVSVGEKDANLILPNTQLVRGITVSVGSFIHEVAKATTGA